jgi:hypothetical protein
MKIILILSLLGLIACSGVDQYSVETTSAVKYRFNDSSVSPAYQRNYEITVTPDKITMEVNSYGDLLSSEEFETSSEDFAKLITQINEAELQAIDVSAGLCDGGTSEELLIEEKGEVVYSSKIEHCGGNELPEEVKNIQTVIDAIHLLIPDYQRFLK